VTGRVGYLFDAFPPVFLSFLRERVSRPGKEEACLREGRGTFLRTLKKIIDQVTKRISYYFIHFSSPPRIP